MLDLDQELIDEKLTKNHENCVILFSKKGCPICQQVTPIIEELEQEYSDSDVHFYHVDSIKEKELMSKMFLKGVPQVLFFKDGDFRGKYAGIRDEEEYRNILKDLV